MNESNVIPFRFNGRKVQFTSDGWLHATAIATSFSKEPYAWLVSPDTAAYMLALARALGLIVNPSVLQEFNQINELDSSKAATKSRLLKLVKAIGLVKTKSGSPENGGGTWLHPKLAVQFARWLDVDFAVWCDLHIDALLRGELDEKLQFDRACRNMDRSQSEASQGAQKMARHRWAKPRLQEQVEYWRGQLQLTLGLETT